MSSPHVAAPRFEHHGVALGIGEAAPRITFEVTSPSGWLQRAYEIQVRTDGSEVTTGPVVSDDSVLVEWPVAPLRSRQVADVRVRVWGQDAAASSWSDWATVEAGLLEPSDWLAIAVSPAVELGGPDENSSADPLLRHEFIADGEVVNARLYVTAHGVYDTEINGVRVGEDVLNPGWTSYGSRLRYHTYDVTALLRPGANALGAWLGNGWYRGRLGFHGGASNRYGDRVAFLAQLEVRLADGRRLTVVTDQDWRYAEGPIRRSGIYDGETYDAREYPDGWSSPGFDHSTWKKVEQVAIEPSTLVAPDGPPVRCTQEVTPVKVWTAPSGATLVDFGQNLVGRLRIRVSGERGHTVRIRHAEVLQDGELCTRPLRQAEATDSYTLSGDAPEVWEPRFTFHGFRFAEITGWPASDVADNVVACVYHTDMRRTGHFECSNSLVNRLHQNVLWSMRGNFLDIPMDCPQRDERLGWTGDIQVFAPTAAFLYDCTGMLKSWLADLAVEQLPDGTVPWYVPYIDTIPMWSPPQPSAVWGDVAVLTPWDLFISSGDRKLLADQYQSAKAWVDLVTRMAGESCVWESGQQLGDWLDPTAPPDDPAAAMTDPHLVATAYFAWSADKLAKMASVLGRTDDQDRYTLLAERVRAAFCARFVGTDGLLTSDTQTGWALALSFDLLPDEVRKSAGDRLAELVSKAGNKIATGFAGTPLVTEALTRTGHVETAYAMLLERECPSWLYAVDMDATTTWERWDSLLPDGSVNPGNMTSFNHYALGAVASWLHRRVAGLSPLSPGYREIRFEPYPGGGLTYAAARHSTPYGSAAIRWDLEEGGLLTTTVTVPTGSTGRVVLPGLSPIAVAAGQHTFTTTIETRDLT